MCVNLGTEVVAEDGNIWKRIVSNLSSTMRMGCRTEILRSLSTALDRGVAKHPQTEQIPCSRLMMTKRASLGPRKRCLGFLYEFLVKTPYRARHPCVVQMTSMRIVRIII